VVQARDAERIHFFIVSAGRGVKPWRSVKGRDILVSTPRADDLPAPISLRRPSSAHRAEPPMSTAPLTHIWCAQVCDMLVFEGPWRPMRPGQGLENCEEVRCAIVGASSSSPAIRPRAREERSGAVRQSTGLRVVFVPITPSISPEVRTHRAARP